MPILLVLTNTTEEIRSVVEGYEKGYCFVCVTRVSDKKQMIPVELPCLNIFPADPLTISKLAQVFGGGGTTFRAASGPWLSVAVCARHLLNLHHFAMLVRTKEMISSDLIREAKELDYADRERERRREVGKV